MLDQNSMKKLLSIIRVLRKRHKNGWNTQELTPNIFDEKKGGLRYIMDLLT